jgi:hypothetical protein
MVGDFYLAKPLQVKGTVFPATSTKNALSGEMIHLASRFDEIAPGLSANRKCYVTSEAYFRVARDPGVEFLRSIFTSRLFVPYLLDERLGDLSTVDPL